MSEGDSTPTSNNPNIGNSKTPSHSEETGYTFTDDPWIRWRNTFNYLTGRLTEEGFRQYKQGRDDRMELYDCKRCEDERDYLLQYSTKTFNTIPKSSALIHAQVL